MIERELDDLLVTWKRRLTAAAQNLVDLHTHPTYQRIAGNSNGPTVQLTGITASRVSPAIQAMGTLFEHFDLIQGVVDRAETMRKDLPMFGSEQRLREIEFLLRGRSIRMPSVQIPLEQRSLLSAVENVEAISPDGLLNAMTAAFDAARDGVLALDAAWKKLDPALTNAKAEITTLRDWDTRTSAGLATELAAAEGALETLRSGIESDPLGVESTFDFEVRARLGRVRAALEAIARDRMEIEAGFTMAASRLTALFDLHGKALAAYAESQEKVGGYDKLKPPQPDANLTELRAWLERLREKYAGGMVKPVTIGLRNWNNALESCVRSEQEAYDANRAPLELRSELRGRLDALKAKARVYGVAEDAALIQIAREAMDLLYSRPTPVQRALDVVARYEAELNSRTARAS